MACLCFGGTDEQEARARLTNKEIDRVLKAEKPRLRRTIKLLLLGAGSSGKSTFVRQMRIIHGTGFETEERLRMRAIIYGNVIECIQSLVSHIGQVGLEYESDTRRQLAAQVANIVSEKVTTPEEFCGISSWVAELWSDAAVKACYERRGNFSLLDSCHYYLSDVTRLASRDYTPTDQDIIRCRHPTFSILEYPFDLDDVTYNIVDVGGQRPERRKWLFCFEGVTSVIFLAALSEYARIHSEDGVEFNGLTESQALLSQVMRSSYLSRASFILFLNKTDVFEERIQRHDLRDFFPEYDGPTRDADAAYEFIEGQFLDCAPMERSGTSISGRRRTRSELEEEPLIYCHRTMATNTDNIRRIFSAVKDTILDRFLNEFNIV